jgi:hypothetical protein
LYLDDDVETHMVLLLPFSPMYKGDMQDPQVSLVVEQLALFSAVQLGAPMHDTWFRIEEATETTCVTVFDVTPDASLLVTSARSLPDEKVLFDTWIGAYEIALAKYESNT